MFDGLDRRPPSPPLTRFQQKLRWARDPVGLLTESAATLGDCFTLTMTGPPMVVFSRPDHVERIFEASPDDLLAGDANAIFSIAFGPRNLLSLDGTEHDRLRHHVGGPLGYRQAPSYSSRMEEVVRRHVAGWPIGVTVDLLDLMQRLALDVILAVLLGTSTPTNDWRDAVAELADRIAALGTQRRRRGSCGHEDALAVSRRRVRALCAEEITRRRDDEANVGGLLDRLAATLPDVGSDTEALLDQLVAFLIAGHETTATALSWAVCRIVGTESVNQEVLAAGDAIEAPSPSKAFLDATILETLRLHPAFAILPRTVTRPFQVGPYHLMPGDVVAPCSYLSHRHPDAWTDPERFDPTRFVVGRPSPAQFYPFGSGARRCLGMHFALLEMRVVLADTFRHWHVQRMNAAMPRPVRRSLTLAPEGGLPVVLTPRRCTHGSVTPRPAHEPANSSP